MSDQLRRLITESRKRAIAGILHHAEVSAWWERLSPREQRELREKVLTSFGVYHDLVLDVIKVGQEDAVLNERTLRLIESIHADTRALARGSG